MKLLIVSNRLPITVEKKDGKFILKESSGGLVSGLSSYLGSLKGSDFPSKNNYYWVGWPGTEVNDKNKDYLVNKIKNEHRGYPVFLSTEIMENFYHGFCNNTIWPLFHYFPSYAKYEEQQWECYKQVNEIFCEAILEIAEPDDIIWIHDYHLMLLPELIREKAPGMKIGFFLHIPFPTYEIFCLLPSQWRTKILKGLLGSDLIGFHTYDYTQYFLRCVLRILGIDSVFGKISYKERLIKADTFPMGIDFPKFQAVSDSISVQHAVSDLKKTLNYEKIILSIDRLDYTKGILNRLAAYEAFLDKNPEWHDRIILLLRIIPSRYGVKHYRKMKRQIDEFVGYLNGKYGNISWSPVSYQYDFLPFIPLLAVYKISDIIMVTPLRDGMNLISKEYIASRTDCSGVLILSEMAGSSKELGEAIIINPNNKEEIAAAISEALSLPLHEQKKRNTIMRSRLKRYDVVSWADEFIQSLISITNLKNERSNMFNEEVEKKLLMDFCRADKKLLILDYDGTLVPFNSNPANAYPDKTLLNLLKKLSVVKGTDIVIISGRDKDTLETWFGDLNISLIAEHGGWMKESGILNGTWKTAMTVPENWKPQVLSILKTYVDRLPDSFIEEKYFSIAWHYRKSDTELASLKTKEFIDQLLGLTANLDMQVLRGNKVIEIKRNTFNKGTAGLNCISRYKYNFVFAAGDDATDEDLFKILPDNAYSIKVGSSDSRAKFYLYNYVKVLDVLKAMTEMI